MIEVALEGNPIPFELCRPESPEKVAAVVKALCDAHECKPLTIRKLPDTEAGKSIFGVSTA